MRNIQTDMAADYRMDMNVNIYGGVQEEPTSPNAPNKDDGDQCYK